MSSNSNSISKYKFDNKYYNSLINNNINFEDVKNNKNSILKKNQIDRDSKKYKDSNSSKDLITYDKTSSLINKSIVFDLKISLDLMIIKLRITYYLNHKSIFINRLALSTFELQEKESILNAMKDIEENNNENFNLFVKEHGNIIEKTDYDLISIFLFLSKNNLRSQLIYVIPKIEIIENNNKHIFIDNSLIKSINNSINLWNDNYKKFNILNNFVNSFINEILKNNKHNNCYIKYLSNSKIDNVEDLILNSNIKNQYINNKFTIKNAIKFLNLNPVNGEMLYFPTEILIDDIFKIIELSKKKKVRDNNINPFQIKNQGILKKETTGNCPYIKSSGFVWSPQGNILFYKISKIDLKHLKENDKVINSVNSLQENINLCITGVVNDDDISQFNERDNFFSINQMLVPVKLNKLVSYESESIIACEEAKFYKLVNDQVLTNYGRKTGLDKNDLYLSKKSSNVDINDKNKIQTKNLNDYIKSNNKNQMYLSLGRLENDEFIKYNIFSEFNEISNYLSNSNLKLTSIGLETNYNSYRKYISNSNYIDNTNNNNNSEICTNFNNNQIYKKNVNLETENNFIAKTIYNKINNINTYSSDNKAKTNIIDLNNKFEFNSKFSSQSSNSTCIFIKLNYFDERNYILNNLKVQILKKDKFYNLINVS